MSGYPDPTVVQRGREHPDAPLVVLLHGRGSNEQDIIGLADLLPDGPAYAAVQAPIAEGGGYAWLDRAAPPGWPVLLVGVQRRRDLRRRSRP